MAPAQREEVHEEAVVAITEETRHTIYEAFRASYGDEVANGLMELLPPVGWADVATKHDLAGLEERMDLRFQLVDQRFDALEARFDLRFQTVEARFGERVERALHRQAVAFIATLLPALALFGVIDRLYG